MAGGTRTFCDGNCSGLEDVPDEMFCYRSVIREKSATEPKMMATRAPIPQKKRKQMGAKPTQDKAPP